MRRSTNPQLRRKLDDLTTHLRRPYELAERTQCSIDKVTFDSTTINLAYTATCDFPALLERPFINDLLKRDPDLLFKHWKAIRFWLIYLISYHVVDESGSIPAKHRDKDPGACVCKFISAVIRVDNTPFMVQGAFKNTFTGDRELFDAVARHWLKQDSEIYMGDDEAEVEEWMESFSPYPTMTMADFIVDTFTLTRRSTTYVTRLLKMAGDNSDLVAGTVVQRLHALTRIRKPTKKVFHDMYAYMNMFPHLFHPSERMIQGALVDNRVIQVQTKALRRCINMYNSDTISKQDLLKTVAIAMSVFHISMSPRPYPSTVRRAIKSRFIESFVQLYTVTRLQDLDIHERQYSPFTRIIPGHLAVYSVLMDTIGALKRLKPKWVRDLQNVSALRELWNATIEKAIYASIFDITWKRNKLRCRGCQQDNMNLWICSGCKAAKYCSVACQTHEWDMHRGVCASHRSESGPAKAMTKAYEFVTLVATYDIRHCFPGILQETERRFSKIPLTDLVIEMDYEHSTASPHQPPNVAIFRRVENPILGKLRVIAMAVVQEKKVAVPLLVDVTELSSIEVRSEYSKRASYFHNGIKIKRSVKTSTFDRHPLATVEWDIIDEIWARVLESVSDCNMNSVWDEIESVVAEVFEEGKL